MHAAPQTWHYGLVARWWAEFNVAQASEVAFYQRWIAADGGRALDLCCGTGRLLLPLLRAGVQVDGCDLSADMIALCRERAERESLAAELFVQPIHALALPRRYRTIFICDSFGIGGSRAQDRAGLVQVRRHLEPGGVLVLSHTLPYSNPKGWGLWFAQRRGQLPQRWPEWDERRTAANGDEMALISRVEAFDPLSQRLTLQMRAGLWRDGHMILEEESRLVETLYFQNELMDLLELAGFASVDVCTADTATAAVPDDTRLTFIARA